MFKRCYIFAVFILLKGTIAAQFFAQALDSVSPYVTVLPFPKDGNYRVVSFDHNFPSIPLHRSTIKVYDSTQQYVKTISLLKGITLVNDYPPLLLNKRLLWPANYNDTIEHNKNSLVILELDTNYTFVNLHNLSTHSSMALPTGLVAYSNGFVVGEYFNGPNVSATGYSTKLFKLNINFQKKDSVLFLDELRLKTHLSNNNRILGASDDLSPTCTPSIQTTQKIVLDTNLAIFSCYNVTSSTIYFCYDQAGNVISITPVTHKRKGIFFPISNYRNYLHGEIDNYNCPLSPLNQAIQTNVYKNSQLAYSFQNSNSPQTTNFPLYSSSNSDYSGSEIIRVASIGLKKNYTVDKSLFKPYFAKPKTKIFVSKIDTTGSELWNKEIGGDMNYFARSVAFTSDGGCVIAGSRYDSSLHYAAGVFENFMIKLDSSGNTVNLGLGISNYYSPNGSGVQCYPNPAQNLLSFYVPEKSVYTICIYSITGQLVVNLKNQLNRTSIDISDLEKGFYLFKIVSSKNVYSGKFFKE